MKNIIKKGLILLLFSLAVPTVSLSQTTLMLDSIQLKELALILAEHEKLDKENPLLKEQINSLEELNKLYVESDSIQRQEIQICKDKIASDEKTIAKMKSTQKKTIIGSSVGGIVLFIIGLIL